MSDFVSEVTTALSAAGDAGAAEGAVGSVLGGAGGEPSTTGLSMSLSAQIGGPLDPSLAAKIYRIDVESHVSLPDSILVAFHDPDQSVISDLGVQLGDPIEIDCTFGSAANSESQKIASGEVTALEMETGHHGNTTIIRGLDLSNRLFRGRKTMAYQQMSASDIVNQLIGDADGLSPGQVDSTDATYSVATQANQSDWEFIQQLARENNRLAFCSQGELNFVEPPDASTAPEVPTSDDADSLSTGQLLMGVNLVRVSISVSAAEQISSVTVGGWDPDQKQGITGQGEAGTVMASNDDSPDSIAGTFGGETFVYTDVPYSDQGQADALAGALAERLGEAYVEVDGETLGNPEIMSATAVAIGGCGDPFDGQYIVTSARHIYDGAHGYRTEFTVSGTRDTTLPGLTTSAWQQSKRHLIPGVVIGTISSIKDPNDSGMVQVQFPWLDQNYVSDWCRVMQPGAGSSWGTILLPEVNSEVLVAFDHGDPRAPYVIGGLYNGQDTMAPQGAPDLVDSGTGVYTQRQLMSRTGHFLNFTDSDSAGLILLQTGDGNHLLQLSQSGQGSITLSSTGSITISSQTNITISAQQSITLNAGTSVSITGGTSVAITGTTSVSVSGAQISISASATLSMSAQASASLSASGTLSLSGAMTSINS
jgi:phage protein D/phage baseplate assembly protein gpV